MKTTKFYKMGLQKGMTNNPAGRPPGTLNRTTTETKEVINEILQMNFTPEQINRDLKKLEPRQRLDVLMKLLNFILPRPLNELEMLTEQQIDELLTRLKKEKFTMFN